MLCSVCSLSASCTRRSQEYNLSHSLMPVQGLREQFSCVLWWPHRERNRFAATTGRTIQRERGLRRVFICVWCRASWRNHFIQPKRHRECVMHSLGNTERWRNVLSEGIYTHVSSVLLSTHVLLPAPGLLLLLLVGNSKANVASGSLAACSVC